MRLRAGQAHQETIRSAKHLGDEKSSVKTPLENLKLKDMERIVGFDDPRNAGLIGAIRQRLEAHGNNGKKAFKEPLYKPAAPGKQAPQIRSVRLFDTQKSGINVRGGIANNGAMIRVDIFTDGKRFYAVPLYVSDAVKSELPNRAVSKSKNGWPEMGEGYEFLFSLNPNDFVRITSQDQKAIEGYYNTLDINNGRMTLYPHDKRGKDQKIRVGFLNALTVQKFHVDLLGRLYPARPETRQPLVLKGGKTTAKA